MPAWIKCSVVPSVNVLPENMRGAASRLTYNGLDTITAHVWIGLPICSSGPVGSVSASSDRHVAHICSVWDFTRERDTEWCAARENELIDYWNAHMTTVETPDGRMTRADWRQKNWKYLEPGGEHAV